VSFSYFGLLLCFQNDLHSVKLAVKLLRPWSCFAQSHHIWFCSDNIF